MKSAKSLIPNERIQTLILMVRGQKVLLDRDLPTLYGVETRALNQAVSRNSERFPADFMFELTRDEIMGISQIVTSSNAEVLQTCHSFHRTKSVQSTRGSDVRECFRQFEIASYHLLLKRSSTDSLGLRKQIRVPVEQFPCAPLCEASPPPFEPYCNIEAQRCDTT